MNIISRITLVTLLAFVPLPSVAEEAEPKQLVRLRESWLAMRERVVRPVDVKYRSELKKLFEQYKRAGRLDDAIAIRKELEKIEKKLTEDPEKKSGDAEEEITPAEKQLTANEWIRSDGAPTVTFHKNGDVTHRYYEQKTIMWAKGEAIWKDNSGAVSIMVLEKDRKTVMEVYTVTIESRKEIVIKRTKGKGKDWVSGSFNRG